MDAAQAERLGRIAIRIADAIINFMVLLALLLLTVFAGYAIWDSNQVYQTASSAQYAMYKPTVDDSVSFEELRAINPEVFAWLTVYGTHIDYPVTQSDNDIKYVNTDVYGDYSLVGSIFLNSRNDPAFADFNSIFYGHHMEARAMFGELGTFSNKEVFDLHPHGNLFYNGKEKGIVFFAFLKADAYDRTVFNAAIKTPEKRREYLDQLRERAMHLRDVQVTENDQIVLLTTCSSDSTNGRDILVGKLTDKLYTDTFQTQKTNNGRVSVDRQDDALWAWIPLWVKIIIPILIVLDTLLCLCYISKRKRNGGRHNASRQKKK